MQIVRLDVFPIAIPLARPMRMAGRTISDSKSYVVRLVTSGREVGWGEANVATLLTGETAESISADLVAIEQAIRGQDARNLRRLHEMMAAIAPKGTSARAAVDIALHDVVARSLGISVSRLVGGNETPPDRAIALIDPAEADWLEECRHRFAEGARMLKLKCANAPLEQEIANALALRQDLGPDLLLAADSNGGWSAEETRRFCDGVIGADMLFLEQPMAPGKAEEMADVARQTPIPFGADEAIHGDEDIVACRASGSAKGVSLKLIKLGGITGVRDAAALTLGLGLKINLSGKVGETSIANAANLHTSTVLGAVEWGVSLTAAYMAGDVVRNPVGLVGQRSTLAGPGLGISVDERLLVDLSTSQAAQ